MNFWVKKLLPILIITLLVVFLLKIPVLAKQGCCSYHKGVCGCDSSVGRQICCDGTYSPTCTCIRVAPKLPPSPKPSPKPSPIQKQKSSPVPAPEVLGVDSKENQGSDSFWNLITLTFIGAVGGLVYMLKKKASEKH